MSLLRSLLFVPATREDRFARAIATGADAVCLDLEDAVAAQDKVSARAAVARLLSRPRDTRCAVGVRINPLASEWAQDDLAEIDGRADFIMLPKADSADAITGMLEMSGKAVIWPLIETAEGLRAAWHIAAAERVEGVLFGAFDYAADIGCLVDWEPLLYARGRLAAACGRARVQLLDAPFADYRDRAALIEATRRAKAMGFTGRACIHPDQVAAVNQVYTPEQSEIEHARRVLAAFDAAAGGAAQLDGRMIDLPVALSARRVLARAGA